MSEYNLFAGVDENYHFPPEVRAALIESLNIRNYGAPMTTAERNALQGSSLDPGYYIFNTDSQSYQVWRADFEEWHDGLESPGSVKEWPGPVIPAGWMKRNGVSLPRDQYIALFEVIGTTYGGSGTPTHFNLPNTGGLVTIDVTTGYALGQKGGYSEVSLGVHNLPSHNHSGATQGQSNNHSHPFTTGGQSADHYHIPFGNGGYYLLDGIPGNGTQHYLQPYLGSGNFFRSESGSSTAYTSNDHSHSGTTGTETQTHTHGIYAQGGGIAHDNMMPYNAAHMIIKY